jgi:fucose permease
MTGTGPRWRATVAASYIASFAQASVINLVPVLFIPLRQLYGFSYTQLGVLVAVNFIAQVLSDVIFARFCDRYGFRPLAVGAPLTAALGFVLFALSPSVFPGREYVGFLLATVVFAMAGAIIDVTASPIVNAVPDGGSPQRRKRAMSLLHACYALGQVAVVVLTTLALAVFGAENWRWIALCWAAVPLVAGLMFLRCPLGDPVPEGMERMRPRELWKRPAFLLLVLTIVTGAATELCMSQWSSSFMERSLGLPKVWGDVVGMAGFGAMLGLGRAGYGMLAGRLDLHRFMTVCCGLGVVCYLTVAFSPWNALSLAACMLTGLAASMLWPGTLTLAGDRFPAGGAWMFAVLSCSGDLGGSVGNWAMGRIADAVLGGERAAALAAGLGLTTEQLGLRAAVLFAAAFPAICGAGLIVLRRGEARAARRKELP